MLVLRQIIVTKSLIISFLLFNSSVFSQTIIDKNICPNGSFENYKKKSDNIKNAIPWKGIATVDYYQKPLANDTAAQKGARTGECYAGLRYQKKYKEFLEVKLAEPLRRGTKYQIEFYVRLAFWSNATLKEFGAYFSKNGFKGFQGFEKQNLVDTIAKKGSLIGGYKWIKITGVYQAGGGEKYIALGNFEDSRKAMQKLNIFKPGFKEAYYFVDDVSLKAMKNPEDEIKIVVVGSSYEKDSVLQVKQDIHVGEKITLREINFEKARSYITPESYGELNKFVQYLLRHPSFQIQINGHSDNTGSAKKNQKLSEDRARAVFEYLIEHGVQNKMFYKGYGNTQPIATNDTEEGKAKNRRVEFEIIKE